MSPTSYRTAPPRAKVNSFPADFQRLKDLDFKFAIRNPQSQMPLVGLGRVELPTSRLSGVRSNQLSYRPMVPSASYNAKKSHTPLRCGPFLTVDAPEGRVASVANKLCLRSTLLPNCERSTSISNLRS